MAPTVVASEPPSGAVGVAFSDEEQLRRITTHDESHL
jgi:hypothetical protein